MEKESELFNTRMEEFYKKISSKKEKWKRIYVGDEPTCFYISNLGRIHDVKRNTVKDCEYDRCKYMNVELKDGDLLIKTSLHRLVAYYFNKIPKRHAEAGLTYKDLVVNHKNGIPSCNAAFNLEWCTQYENMEHAFVTDLCLGIFGENSHLATIDNKTVTKICELMVKGMSNSEIREQINVSDKLLNHIRYGESWKRISSKYKIPKLSDSTPYSLGDEVIHDVCKLLEEHKYSDVDISRMTGVSRRYITEIRNGEKRKDISSQYNINKASVDRVSTEAIEKACKLLSEKKLSQRKIAKEAGISQCLVSELFNKKKFTEISNKYF